MSNGRAMGRQNVNALNRACPETNVCLIPYKYARDPAARDRGPFLAWSYRHGVSSRTYGGGKRRPAWPTRRGQTISPFPGTLPELRVISKISRVVFVFFFLTSFSWFFFFADYLGRNGKKKHFADEYSGREMQRFIMQKENLQKKKPGVLKS